MAQKEYTAIRVTPEAKNAAEESKRDDETWDEFVQRCTDNPAEVVEVVPVDEIQDAIADLSLDVSDLDVESGSDLTPDDVKAAAERGVEQALRDASI